MQITDEQRQQLAEAIEKVQFARQRVEIERRARDTAVRKLGELMGIPPHEERVTIHDGHVYTIRRGYQDEYHCSITRIDIDLPF
jgi:hypothetical protein